MKKLAEVLLERGLVSKEKLEAALKEKEVTHERIGRILVRNGFLRQDTLIALLRETNPDALHEEATLQSVIPSEVLAETRSMISAKIEDALYVSTLSSPHLVRAKFAPYLGGMRLTFTPANPRRISDYIAGLGAERGEQAFSWERIFHDAMRLGASDIHVMPRYQSYTAMLRRDGVLNLHHEGPLDEYTALVSRVKDLAKMDMAERRRPQDGSFQMEFTGRVVNFRVVTIPTVEGERMVVRILDPDSVNHELGQLGITRLDLVRRAVARPDGLFLVCGPTGSGKTTTLAAILREMNFLERAIYTVEDPVENRIPYAGQVNVNPVLQLGFAEAVRTFMRGDPDVIMVGEVRDADTARNAIKAGETGHMTLASLHTNSITTTIGRLMHIGVEPHELHHLLRGAMVQRLMRTYCKHCHGKGCPLCGHSGYKGRTVVSEVAYFHNVDAVLDVINGKVNWVTIEEDAKLKVEAGITSAAEFERVFGYPMSAPQPKSILLEGLAS